MWPHLDAPVPEPSSVSPFLEEKELSGVDVPDFDLRTVKVLGSPSGSRVTRIWCTRPSVAKSWKEVLQLGKKLTNGAQAPGASFGLGPSFVELTGGPIKMVYGYSGTSDVMAAFDRGELLSTDRCTEEVVPRLFPEWIKKKILVPIFWWEKKPPEKWLKRLGASMPPHLLDIVDATPEQKKTLEVAIGFASLSRIFDCIRRPIKMVYGYSGTSDVMAAFDRGELLSTDRCTEEVVPRLFPEWIKKKILVPIFWWEKKPPEKWLKRLGASMPPHLLDIVDATPEQKKTLEVAIGFAAMSRIFVMPPGVPDNIYQIWKSAFVATAKDPEFIKAANIAGYVVSLATSEDFYKNLKTFEKLSPQGKEMLKKLIGA